MSKIIDSSRQVSLHVFHDCLATFEVEWITELSDMYENYKLELAQNKNVCTIADLVKCHEIVNGVEFDDIISVIIYNDGTFKYIACY